MLVVVDDTLHETYGGSVDVMINLVDEHVDGRGNIFPHNGMITDKKYLLL